MVCLDLRLFWEEEMSVEHVFWVFDVYNGRSFNCARIIILEYGARPEDWQVMTSWRLNEDILEASAGDFFDMLEHPERGMPGFWDEDLDSRFCYDRYSWLPRQRRFRREPNRHERKKGMLNRRFWDGY